MNRPKTLTITLLNYTSVGAPAQSVHTEDLGVVTDRYGFPYLPESRILARLRDSVRSYPGLLSDVTSTAAITRLLGATKQLESQRVVVFNDAVLPSTVRQPLVAELLRNPGQLSANARLLTEALSRIIQTTAADDDGAPLPHTLRSIRYLKPGLKFTLPLSWRPEATPEDVRTLARLVLGFEQLGGSESRGFGRVLAALDDDYPATVKLAALRGEVRSTATSVPTATQTAAAPSDSTTAAASSKTVQRIQLVFQLSKEIATDGEYRFIGGTLLRGAIAGVLGRSSKELFKRLIVEDRLEVSNSYPLLTDNNHPLFPTPKHLFETEQHRQINLSDLWQLAENDQIISDISRFNELSTADFTHAGVVQTRRVQRINRYLDDDQAEQLYFEQTVMAQQQRFLAELTLRDSAKTDAQQLKELLESSSGALALGSNKESGFGGKPIMVKVELLDDASTSKIAPGDFAALAQERSYDVVLRSPALVRNSAGEFSPAALPQAVLQRLQAAGYVAELSHSFVQPLTITGTSSRIRAARPVHLAADAGSVVRLKITNTPAALSQEQAAALAAPLGARLSDGFGVWQLSAVDEQRPQRNIPNAGSTLFSELADSDAATPVSNQDDPAMTGLLKMLDHSIETTTSTGLLRQKIKELLAAQTASEAATAKQAEQPQPQTGETEQQRFDSLAELAGTTLKISTRIVLLSDTTLSSGAKERAQQGEQEVLQLFRDHDGKPFLSGSSLAGALRHNLRKRLGLSPGDQDSAELQKVFGKTAEGKLSKRQAQSRLRVFGAQASLPPGYPTAIRKGIRHDRATGTVAQGALFAAEVLPAGTTFPVSFLFTVPSEETEAQHTLQLLAMSLAGLDAERIDSATYPAAIRLGAKKGKGRGQLKSRNWRIEVFDLNSGVDTTHEGSADYARWFAISPQQRSDSNPGDAKSFSDALTQLVGDESLGGFTPQDLRDEVLISGTLLAARRFGQKLLPSALHSGDTAGRVLQEAPATGDPRVSTPAPILERPTLATGDNTPTITPTDSGTVLHAVLKAAALRHLLKLSGQAALTGELKQFFAGLFGSEADDTGRLVQSQPSRVLVQEAPLTGGASATAPRIRVDPITRTGGVSRSKHAITGYHSRIVTTADSVASIEGGSSFLIRVSRPTAEELALIGLVVADLEAGRVSTGGLNSIGYGGRVLINTRVFQRNPRENENSAAVSAGLDSILKPQNFTELVRLINAETAASKDREAGV